MIYAQSRRSFLNTLGGMALASLTGCGGGTNSAVLPVNKTPLLIPAYFFDRLLWSLILPAHTPAHTLIVNVQTGPGVFPSGATPVPDPAWHKEFASATANGHTLLGYVDTNYGIKTVAAVQAEVVLWNTLYGIQNIFFDRVGAPIGSTTSTSNTILAYYTTLVNAIRAKMLTARIVLNCGTIPLAAYFQIDSLTEIIVFEDTWAAYQTTNFPAWMNSYWSRSHIIVNTAPFTALASVHNFVGSNNLAGYFVTDQTTANYALSLPSYWGAELAL